MELYKFFYFNGWLQAFKWQLNLLKMISGGKHDDVIEEVLESWSKWAKLIMKEYKPEVVQNMDLTGCLWEGLPNTSINRKGVQCRGEKKVKQCNPGHFLSNYAAGRKEDLIRTGWYGNPRYLKYTVCLFDKDEAYGCWCYSYTWMTTEVMKEVLTRLNAKFKIEGQKILLLMINAPCHPESLGDSISNITIKFLPKNTSFKMQPLDAGIIANYWKINNNWLL